MAASNLRAVTPAEADLAELRADFADLRLDLAALRTDVAEIKSAVPSRLSSKLAVVALVVTTSVATIVTGALSVAKALGVL